MPSIQVVSNNKRRDENSCSFKIVMTCGLVLNGGKKQVASEAKITTGESQEAKDERSILTKDHLS